MRNPDFPPLRSENAELADLVRNENITGNGPEIGLLMRAQSYIYNNEHPSPLVQERMLQQILFIKKSGPEGELRALNLAEEVGGMIRRMMEDPDDSEARGIREKYYTGWSNKDLADYHYFLTGKDDPIMGDPE